MNKCIFCESTTNSFRQVEHVVPESLGGEMILPKGLVCDKCNNYFGRSVEDKALNAPIISFLRASLNAQNKRGKYWRHVGLDWEVQGGFPDPNLILSEGRMRWVQAGRKGEIRILAHAGMSSICRLMLKMGVENLALDSDFDVFDEQFSAARKAARSPHLGTKWPIAASNLNVDQTILNVGYDIDGEFYEELIYSVDLALDDEFGMVGVHFIYGWARFIVPLNDVGKHNFEIIVLRHNLNHIDENAFTVLQPDITTLD